MHFLRSWRLVEVSVGYVPTWRPSRKRHEQAPLRRLRARAQAGAPIPPDAWEYHVRAALNDACYQSLDFKPFCSHMPVCRDGCKQPQFMVRHERARGICQLSSCQLRTTVEQSEVRQSDHQCTPDRQSLPHICHLICSGGASRAQRRLPRRFVGSLRHREQRQSVLRAV